MTFFDLLNQKKYLVLFLLVSAGFFALNYQLMARLPGGGKNLMCEVGGGLTPENLTFGFVLSAMGGLLITGFIALLSQKKAKVGWKAGSASTLGMGVGLLTTFCTLCTLPVISLFGLGVGLSFFTEYELWFKVLSLILLGASLYLLNKQLKEQCRRCVE